MNPAVESRLEALEAAVTEMDEVWLPDYLDELRDLGKPDWDFLGRVHHVQRKLAKLSQMTAHIQRRIVEDAWCGGSGPAARPPSGPGEG